MKNLVTTLLGIAFMIVGSNIANLLGYDPPTNLQQVAASTAPQPIDNLIKQVRANPEVVHDTIRIERTTPCNHKQQPVKTIVKRTIIKKTDTSYVPLLYVIEGDKEDSLGHAPVRIGELRDYKQIISKVHE